MEGMTFTLIVVLMLNILTFTSSVEDDNAAISFASLVSSIILLASIGVLIFKY